LPRWNTKGIQRAGRMVGRTRSPASILQQKEYDMRDATTNKQQEAIL